LNFASGRLSVRESNPSYHAPAPLVGRRIAKIDDIISKLKTMNVEERE
jgi:hypothetical protein